MADSTATRASPAQPLSGLKQPWALRRNRFAVPVPLELSMKVTMNLAQVYEAALQSSSCRLRAIVYAQLAEDAVDVTLDRCFAYVQPAGDCFVAVAGHDLFEHFDLSSG